MYQIIKKATPNQHQSSINYVRSASLDQSNFGRHAKSDVELGVSLEACLFNEALSRDVIIGFYIGSFGLMHKGTGNL